MPMHRHDHDSGVTETEDMARGAQKISVFTGVWVGHRQR